MNAPLEVNAAAAELAGEGFRVFEIPGRDKAPPIAGWQAAATSDPQKAGRIPTSSNLGIATGGGILVLDVDGDAGARSLAALELMHGKLPETCKVRTPSGGAHFYFAGPDVANSAGKLGACLDVRGLGGYVCAPGSRTAAGEYVVEHAAEPAPAPQWLLMMCNAPREKRDKTPASAIAPVPDHTLEQARAWLAQQPVGGGHSYASACGLRDRGLSLAQAREVFTEHDPRPDAIEQVDHAYRYATGKPGAKVAVQSDFPVPIAQPQPQAEVPAAPRTKGGSLQDIARRINTGAYLVKGLLRRASHAVMYGAPGEGKSYVALDLSYHVAAGREWHGRRVSQGPVLYLAFEGLGGMPERAAALLQHYGREPVPFVIEPAAWNLREKAERQSLTARLAEIRAEHFAGQAPALIVLDTLARAMRGGDENSAADMGALNDAVAALIAATGACVVLVHHSGKDRSKGARGSSALLGAVDTEIEVDGRRIIPSKQRDMATGEPQGFKLAPVVVGEDSDGEPLQACVVLPDAAPRAGQGWEAYRQGCACLGGPVRAWAG